MNLTRHSSILGGAKSSGEIREAFNCGKKSACWKFERTLYSPFGEPVNQFSQKEAKELVHRNNTAMLDLIKEVALRNASNSIPQGN